MRTLLGFAFFAFFTALAPSLVVAQSNGESNVAERNIGGTTYQSERDEQAALFNYYFRNQDLTYQTKLSELSTEATVPKWRIPYSGAIYPEVEGGLSNGMGSGETRQVRGLFGRVRTIRVPQGRGRFGRGGTSALNVYDQAFHNGEDRANAFEVRRIASDGGPARYGLFGFVRYRGGSEAWEGYCSGFTASTIRHPEPVRSVDASEVGGKRGVVFRPEHIKALLTGIYNRTTDDSFLFLSPPSSRSGGPNMGTFHLTLANYIGQGECPVGIDRTKGRVAWNNPIYSYKSRLQGSPVQRGELTYQDVNTTIVYSFYGSDSQLQTNRETGDRTGHRRQSMTMQYTLMLDDEGHIVGGRARSGAGHFLWLPLYAVQAKRDGSVPGNPHLDITKVLALARASALPEVQAKYDAVAIGELMDPAVLASAEGESESSDTDAQPTETEPTETDSVELSPAATSDTVESPADA